MDNLVKENEGKILSNDDSITGVIKEIKFEKDKDISGALSKEDKSEYTFENPFKGVDLSNGASLTFKTTAIGQANHLGALITIDGEAGRMYISPTSYLGYNATGGIFDANMKGFAAVKNHIGEGTKLITITFDNNGFSLYVNGEKAFDQSIVTYVDNMDDKVNLDDGRGTVSDYSKILEFLQNADYLRIGYGSWWQFDGGDNANFIINNIAAYDKILSISEMQTVAEAVTKRFVDYEEYIENIKQMFELNTKLKHLLDKKIPDIMIVRIPKFRAISGDIGKLMDWSWKENRHETLFKEIIFGCPDFTVRYSDKFEYTMAVKDNVTDADVAPYKIHEFEGGLYAVSMSIDGDHESIGKVEGKICERVENTTDFMYDISRGVLGTMPYLSENDDDEIKKGLGYNQLYRFMPIKLKEDIK